MVRVLRCVGIGRCGGATVGSDQRSVDEDAAAVWVEQSVFQGADGVDVDHRQTPREAERGQPGQLWIQLII